MNLSRRDLLLWAPRILGILLAAFLGMFALDAVEEGAGAFLMHLAPALLVLAVVAVSWRWEWVGGTVFIALAVFYAVEARDHWNWIVVVAGPMLVVGALFLVSWRRHGDLHVRR